MGAAGSTALMSNCVTSNHCGLLVSGITANNGCTANNNCITDGRAANGSRTTDGHVANGRRAAGDPCCVPMGCCSADSDLTALPAP